MEESYSFEPEPVKGKFSLPRCPHCQKILKKILATEAICGNEDYGVGIGGGSAKMVFWCPSCGKFLGISSFD